MNGAARTQPRFLWRPSYRSPALPRAANQPAASSAAPIAQNTGSMPKAEPSAPKESGTLLWLRLISPQSLIWLRPFFLAR
jgi:hypothetical protein